MPDTLATELRLSCLRIARRVRYESTLEIAPHLYSVLIHVEKGTHSPRALAETEQVSAPSMTRTLNALDDAGLIVRTPHPSDGRQVLVELTDAGRSLIERTRASRDSWMTRRIDALDEAERALLEAALPALSKVAQR